MLTAGCVGYHEVPTWSWFEVHGWLSMCTCTCVSLLMELAIIIGQLCVFTVTYLLRSIIFLLLLCEY